LTSFAIRPATSADIPALLPLQKEIHDCHVAHHPAAFHTAGPEEVVPWLQQWFADPNFHCYVALEGDEFAGYVFAWLSGRDRSALCNSRRFVNLDQLSVRRSSRRRGIGRALVQAVIELARQNDITDIDLSVWWGNTEAREFYRSLGFGLMREYYTLKVV
jgi:diamine N-acetyltransferase